MLEKYNFLKNPKKDFAEAISSPEYFQNRNVYFIEHSEGKYVRDYLVNDFCGSFDQYFIFLTEAIKKRYTFKIEKFELYNENIYKFCLDLYEQWKKPVNCHAYFGFGGHGSFDMHTDMGHVLIVILDGTKEIEFLDNKILLNKGDSIYISPNKPHKAINITDCLSLSFGSIDYDGELNGFYV